MEWLPAIKLKNLPVCMYVNVYITSILVCTNQPIRQDQNQGIHSQTLSKVDKYPQSTTVTGLEKMLYGPRGKVDFPTYVHFLHSIHFNFFVVVFKNPLLGERLHLEPNQIIF